MNPDRINALFCAINVLQGTAGGFSEHEKQNAINQLHNSVPGSDVAIAVLNGFGHTISAHDKREAIEHLQRVLTEEEQKGE